MNKFSAILNENILILKGNLINLKNHFCKLETSDSFCENSIYL